MTDWLFDVKDAQLARISGFWIPYGVPLSEVATDPALTYTLLLLTRQEKLPAFDLLYFAAMHVCKHRGNCPKDLNTHDSNRSEQT